MIYAIRAIGTEFVKFGYGNEVTTIQGMTKAHLMIEQRRRKAREDISVLSRKPGGWRQKEGAEPFPRARRRPQRPGYPTSRVGMVGRCAVQQRFHKTPDTLAARI